MNNKSFGLDIGATTIKAVSLSRSRGGFLLDSSFIGPIPPKGMLSESLLDEQTMAEAIRRVVDSAKITSKNVNIALSENQVHVSVIEMPVLSNKELGSAIYWEAEKYIPVPLSDVNLVWNVLKRPQNIQTPANEKMLVLIVGAPTMVINKYQRVLAMAGLNIVSLEIEILSAIRALVHNGGTFPQTVIINIGAASTSLAIIKDGILIFTYSTPTGGGAINRALEADFGLTLSASEEYKKVYGMSKEGVGGKIGSAIEPIITSIVDDVKKTLAFYSEKYKDDSPIQQILLSGGTARLQGIQLFFAEKLGIETAIANPWGILTNQDIPREMLDNASDYTIAVGLAMRGYG